MSDKIIITSGRLKFKGLKFPQNIRPTSNKVREALFSVLGNNMYGSLFLDVFAGSGSVGLQALSLGAEKAVFVEKDRTAVDCLLFNLEHCGINYSWRLEHFVDNEDCKALVLHEDFEEALPRLFSIGIAFDVAFADPPYDSDGANLFLLTLSQYVNINSLGLVVVEHKAKKVLPKHIGRLALTRQRRYGTSSLSFYLFDNEKDD